MSLRLFVSKWNKKFSIRRENLHIRFLSSTIQQIESIVRTSLIRSNISGNIGLYGNKSFPFYHNHSILYNKRYYHPAKSLFDKKTSKSTEPIQSSSNSWIDTVSWIPDRVRPFLHLARADKQVGTMLLLWPCCWSVALAAPMDSWPDILLMCKFGIGAIIMRSAGCTINDLWDKDFDKHVERTKNRPLATGVVTVLEAFIFLGLQLSAGLCVLLSFNFNSILLGFGSMPLVIIYPLMKRYTNWPQLILGLTFNWGALMGWTAVHGMISWSHVLPLYAAGVGWTLLYDTLYAYQDRKDDIKLGLKSTSLYLGDKPQIPLTIIASGSILGFLWTGYVSNLSLPYYIGILGIGSHYIWQIWTADINDSKNLWNRFSSNKYIGAAVTASIIAGHF